MCICVYIILLAIDPIDWANNATNKALVELTRLHSYTQQTFGIILIPSDRVELRFAWAEASIFMPQKFRTNAVAIDFVRFCTGIFRGTPVNFRKLAITTGVKARTLISLFIDHSRLWPIKG